MLVSTSKDLGMITLRYERGTILVKGIKAPNARWDARRNCYVALAVHYPDIVAYLRDSGLEFRDYVLNLIPCPHLECNVSLRGYQKKAVEVWERAGRRGVVVLPTGAGKTLIGLKAISQVNAPSLVVVPTLDLLQQWAERLEAAFSEEIGIYGGGEHTLRPLTVSTYDSAYSRIEELGDKFSLLIFDEVHHLPSPGYRQIAELSAAPFRLGLTATYEREDGLHEELPRLVGGKIFELGVKHLTEYLADYELRRIRVPLTDDERQEYEEAYSKFLNFIRSKGVAFKSRRDFERFIMMSVRDKNAREALVARNRARSIAFNSKAKLEKLRELLEQHKDEKILIFTEHNELVHRISKEFLVPYITHKTDKNERKSVLNGFKEGRYRVVVTSKVLDEGVDVPDASVGIILSGSGSRREFVQRLGRLLRKKEGKRAILYEVVSDTFELGVSRRRRKKAQV